MNAMYIYPRAGISPRGMQEDELRIVDLAINHQALHTFTLQRMERHYFEKRYAEPRDLMDLGGHILPNETFCHRLELLWPKLEARLRALMMRRAVTLEGGRLAVRCDSVPDEKRRRLIVKNANDYLLHSAAADLLQSIHPLMAQRASQRALRSVERVVVMIEK